MGRVEGSSLTPTANEVLRFMQAEVGYREGYNNDNKYAAWAGHMNHQPWCATFLEGCTNKIGKRDLIPDGQVFASCDALFTSFQKINRWSHLPAIGAIFFIGKPGYGSVIDGRNWDLYHTGIVYAWDDYNIYTIEGNTNNDGSSNGNGVYRRVRRRTDSTFYAYPKYPEGILSADPKWKDQNPKPAPVRPKSVDLNILHLSMQHGDSLAQQKKDANKLFDYAVDKQVAWITGTEAGPGSKGLPEALDEIGRKHGFAVYVPVENRDDAWIAVNKKIIQGRTERKYYPVLPGANKYKGATRKWGPKGVVRYSFANKALAGPEGMVTLLAGHYLPGGRRPGKASQHGGVNHYDENEKIAREFGKRAREFGKGSSVVFVGADVNMNDSKADQSQGDVFFGAPITTLGDELKYYPNTGHGPIDVMGTYDADGRVTARSLKVLDDKKMFLRGDHFLVHGIVRVELWTPGKK